MRETRVAQRRVPINGRSGLLRVVARSMSEVATVISVNYFGLLEATGDLKVRVLKPERNLSATLEM